MQKLDVAIVLLVILGGVACYRAGFTRSVWGIAAVSAGVCTANHLWYRIAPILQRLIEHPGFSKWASIIIIAVGVSIAVDVLFDRVQSIMEKGVLGWINSIVGGVFGVMSSVILIACALFVFNRFGGDVFDKTAGDSRLAPPLVKMGRQIVDFGRVTLEKQAGKL